MTIANIIKNELNAYIDAHIVFYKIYKNYDKYNLISYQYCKGYLQILFELDFGLCIDLDKIWELSKNDKNIDERQPQQIFRKKLIEKFETCAVTGNDVIECDAAHINDLINEKLNYSINNGLLLTKSLHVTFDNLIWCINPDTYMIEIKPTIGKLLIHNYIDKNMEPYIDEYMVPYLRKKYEKFIGLPN
jgi:hypothetical protein